MENCNCSINHDGFFAASTLFPRHRELICGSLFTVTSKINLNCSIKRPCQIAAVLFCGALLSLPVNIAKAKGISKPSIFWAATTRPAYPSTHFFFRCLPHLPLLPWIKLCHPVSDWSHPWEAFLYLFDWQTDGFSQTRRIRTLCCHWLLPERPECLTV